MVPGHLVLADLRWRKVAIDIEVGDYTVVPDRVDVRGESARPVGDCRYGRIILGIRPGLTQLVAENDDWAAMVRVSRKQFTGRGAYRHLEDPDESE
jgi:hypothetical protein